MENEIKERFDILGVDPNAAESFIYIANYKKFKFDKIPFYGSLLYTTIYDVDEYSFGHVRDKIKELKETYSSTVYAVIFNRNFFIGDMLTYLTVSCGEICLDREKEDLRILTPMAYVENLTYPCQSKWSPVQLKVTGDCIERVG